IPAAQATVKASQDTPAAARLEAAKHVFPAHAALERVELVGSQKMHSALAGVAPDTRHAVRELHQVFADGTQAEGVVGPVGQAVEKPDTQTPAAVVAYPAQGAG
ncbi:MAG: hypothetical protein JXB35_17860, partial [Anaerolineae bacterium]|nr:hypothetical protein [Anaerolineae bacterium]